MSDGRESPRIFISVAEQSADEHAAGLIRAYCESRAGAQFVGLAGPAMQAAGCTPLADLTARASMLLGVAGRLPAGIGALLNVDRFLARSSVDAAVLVDSGTLHLPMARRCQARGVPVFYFIAPQTWASREYRLRPLRRRVTRMAVILPFEEEYFRANGIDARYVGHPLFDRLAQQPMNQARVAELRGDASSVIALLPGSREHVVREVYPGQLEVAEAVVRRNRRAKVLVAAANKSIAAVIESIHAVTPQRPDVQVLTRDRTEIIGAADLALVASGTGTLEVAYHRTPMIVMYNARGARWLYPLLRTGGVIKTQFLSLPNILAGRKIVPEFMPSYRSTAPIAMAALELLSSSVSLDRMRADLAALMDPIVRTGACAAAAGELATMLDESPGSRRIPSGSRHRIW